MVSITCVTSFVLAAILVVATAPPAIAVHGRILDTEGAGIKGARVLFHADPAGEVPPLERADITRETDDEGLFDLEVAQGFYDVCVMATGFTPECKKIYATDGQSIRYDSRLRIDPLVVRVLGDKFKDPQ